MVIRMLTEFGRRMDKYGKSFNKETENIRKSNRSHRAKEYNYSTKITLKGFNNRLDEVEQQVERPNNGTHQDSATNRKKKI